MIGLPVAELLADLQALETLPRYPRPAFGNPANHVSREDELRSSDRNAGGSEPL